jgi:hypothetical protein
MASKPRRFPSFWNDSRFEDRAVEIFILAGCGRCGRRLENTPIGGQKLEHKKSYLGWRICCDPCVARLMGMG